MFILINNIPYNSYAISSFNKGLDVRTTSEGEEILVYCINYQLVGGSALKEEYTDQKSRDDAYNELLVKLVK